MDYIFPFSTCEVPQKGILKQPYSVLVNFVIIIMLVYFISQAKTKTIRYVFFAFLLFEIFHAFSHAFFIDSHIQQYIIHFLAYNIAFGTLFAILFLTKSRLSYSHIFLIVLLVIIDLFTVYFYAGLYMIISGFFLFTVILSTFYIKYPVFALYFIVAVSVLILLIINEHLNCKHMIAKYPEFPFHIIIEFYGLILFYIISNKLLSLES